jgi:hypothetical protein
MLQFWSFEEISILEIAAILDGSWECQIGFWKAKIDWDGSYLFPFQSDISPPSKMTAIVGKSLTCNSSEGSCWFDETKTMH